MNKILAFCTCSLLAFACKTPLSTTSNKFQEIEHRMNIKNVVDVFSILADQKKTEEQTLLFTENAIVETIMNGNVVGTMQGRKQIGDTFASFLNNFETVYHINGQQTVDLKGNEAKTTSYCLVTLIGTENGKKMKTTFGIFYNDDFVLENGRWLISKRRSTFQWQEKEEMK